MLNETKNAYTPPADLWEVDAKLEFNAALPDHDPRYVTTAQARGDFNFSRLTRALGVDDREAGNWQLRQPRPRSYHVFCGHRGCGKSTELRRLARQLHGPQAFFVIFIDVLEELDYNNLQYSDVLLTLAKQLFEQLEVVKLAIDSRLLENLEDWFKERIETHSATYWQTVR